MTTAALGKAGIQCTWSAQTGYLCTMELTKAFSPIFPTNRLAVNYSRSRIMRLLKILLIVMREARLYLMLKIRMANISLNATIGRNRRKNMIISISRLATKRRSDSFANMSSKSRMRKERTRSRFTISKINYRCLVLNIKRLGM